MSIRAYSIAQLCQSLGVSRSKIYEEIAAGRLKAVKAGRRTLITEFAVGAWLDSLPEKESAAGRA